MLALDFEDIEFVQKVVNNCLEYKLITDWFLFNPTCMRIAPPLIITKDQIRKAAGIIMQAINLADS